MRLALVGLLAFPAQLTSSAHADTLDWSATLEGRVGYGSNPFLDIGQNNGSGLAGFTIAPVLTWRNAKATTVLSGSYNRDQYFSHYGDADDTDIELRRQQQITERLLGTAHIGYFSSISALLSPYYNSVVVDPGAVDQLSVGLRQRRLFGDLGLDYQPTARDRYTLTGNAEHDTYSGFGSTFNYYGITGGYSRQISARTSLGVSVTAGQYDSSAAPSSRSLSPNITLQQVLSAHWTFNGSVGAIIEREHFMGQRRTSVSPGFSAQLCDKETKLSLCVSASRQTASSGLGGLRRQTQFGINTTYNLTEHSRILVAASYGFSKSGGIIAPNVVTSGTLRYALARVDYQRDLTRRLSAGIGGSYQSRTGNKLPEAHALAATVNLTAKLGHIS